VSAGGPAAADLRLRRLLVAAMLTALALLGPRAAGVAQAADPQADFTFAPRAPVVGETVRFTATVSDPDDDVERVAWDLDDDGEFDDATGTSASTRFDAAGGHTVKLEVVDEEDNTVEAAHRVDVDEAPPPAANQPPSAAFTFSPGAPTVGETVTFRSGSTDDGRIVSERWDLDGDGAFDDATGATATRAFAVPGAYIAGLRVTDDQGASSVALRTVQVFGSVAGAPAPAPAAPAPTGARRPAALRLLTPFPIVRIVGTFVGSRVKIKMLAVRAARGALVRVRCRGRGCPARRLSRRSTSYARPVRFRRLERQLRVGTVIEIFVTKRGRIGKYTRFVIRSGAAPLRRDACARPGATRPTRCPRS
jgi:PKD repeat protein